MKSISSYRGLRSEFNFEGDFSPLLVTGGVATRQDTDQYSQELQLQGTAFSERLKWIVGGFYFQEDSHSAVHVLSVFSIFNPATQFPVLTDNRQPTDTESYAFFGQATYDVTDWLHLTAGGRWTRETKESLLVLLPAAPQGLPGDLRTSEFTPMVSISADVADDVMVYASYSEGFRSGSFPPRVVGQVTEIPTFGPEKVTAYEIGVKTEAWDRRLRANLAVFTNDYDDFQAAGTRLDVTPPLGTVINAGNARISGAELEMEALPTETLRLSGSVSYLTNELTSVDPTANSGGVPVTEDSELPFAPKWKASAGISWQLPLPVEGESFLQLDGAYTSRVEFDLANRPGTSQGGVFTLDGNVRYAFPGNHWEIQIGARNLTDRRYFTSRGIDTGLSGVASGVLAMPRMVFGTVRWRY